MIAVSKLLLTIDNSDLSNSTSDCDRSRVSAARISVWGIMILLAAGVCGCFNTAIYSANRDLTNGNYAAAHDKFVAASRSSTLSTREWRELADEYDE